MDRIASDNTDLFERSLAICQEAFDDGHLDAAYHALMAALHLAQDAGDEERLSRVEAIAAERLDWIDRNAPAYAHSSRSATGRGNESIWNLLARQARARQHIAAQEHERTRKNEGAE